MPLGMLKRALMGNTKAHINVDEDGFIEAIAYSAGNVHDSNHFTTLLEGNELAAYADSAYQSQAHTDWLSERGIENRLIKSAYRNRPLSKVEKRFNQTHAGVMGANMQEFAVLSNAYLNYITLRYGKSPLSWLRAKSYPCRVDVCCS